MVMVGLIKTLSSMTARICPIELYASRIGYEIAKYDISKNEGRLILVYGTKFYVSDSDRVRVINDSFIPTFGRKAEN